jgi:small subunit ribosomal protein S1
MVGRVTRVLHFGAFVDLGNGIEGLLHNSEIPDAGGPEINPGSELMLRVVSLDVDRQRVGLSLQELDEDQIASNDVPPLMKSDSSQDAGEVPMNTALDEDDTTEELPEPKGGD